MGEPTPGPLSVFTCSDIVKYVDDDKVLMLGWACAEDVGRETREANAYLWAAAPDLLRACEALANHPNANHWCQTCEPYLGRHETDCPVSLARAAIAKARGEAQ